MSSPPVTAEHLLRRAVILAAAPPSRSNSEVSLGAASAGASLASDGYTSSAHSSVSGSDDSSRTSPSRVGSYKQDSARLKRIVNSLVSGGGLSSLSASSSNESLAAPASPVKGLRPNLDSGGEDGVDGGDVTVPDIFSKGEYLRQNHECSRVELVLVHEPSLAHALGSLHPIGSLVEAWSSHDKWVATASELSTLMSEQGIPLVEAVDIMTLDCDTDPAERRKLEDLAFDSLRYQLVDEGDDWMRHGDESMLTDEELFLLSDEYKRGVIRAMPLQQLSDIIMTQPVVELVKSGIDSVLATCGVRTRPMSAFTYVRDTHAVTRRGVILGRMTSVQRRVETKVMKHIFSKLGTKYYEIPENSNCFLEGSDFLACGEQLSFIGTGQRTNHEAVQYLLANDLIGTRRVAVVKDCLDRSYQRLHLGRCMCILQEDLIAVNDQVMGPDSPRKRLVDEYCRDAHGKYQLVRRNVELSLYLNQQGFTVVALPSTDGQDCANVLNLGGGKVLVAGHTLKVWLESIEAFGGTVVHVSDPMLGLNGMVSVLKRQEGTKLPLPTPPKAIGVDCIFETSNEVRQQTTNTVLMVAPNGFYCNLEACKDNHFMVNNTARTKQAIQKEALLGFTDLHMQLTRAGVKVMVFTSEVYHATPDAVFPNNWFSTHRHKDDSVFVLYPMKVHNRRRERRPDIISELTPFYNRTIDLTHWEGNKEYLESTGSMVLDRVNMISYVAVSERSHASVCLAWAQRMGFSLVTFTANDGQLRPIYHTNVMMAMGTGVVIICLESITDMWERKYTIEKLSATHVIIDISLDQVTHFCGNVIEVLGADAKRIMVMSTQAYDHFTTAQLDVMRQHVHQIIHAEFSTIEGVGGGGVRCAIGELF
eukprot:TRINITY_DN259_c0_g3_i1.p1 TRINITY_DN259_c0_g3~~TRINITY_DN259_c0_g3_i1.p1  ORF type:complete len:898 (-),score=192.82 TRINITY_DN259_c0_g3_i1:121-2739(-)